MLHYSHRTFFRQSIKQSPIWYIHNHMSNASLLLPHTVNHNIHGKYNPIKLTLTQPNYEQCAKLLISHSTDSLSHGQQQSILPIVQSLQSWIKRSQNQRLSRKYKKSMVDLKSSVNKLANSPSHTRATMAVYQCALFQLLEKHTQPRDHHYRLISPPAGAIWLLSRAIQWSNSLLRSEIEVFFLDISCQRGDENHAIFDRAGAGQLHCSIQHAVADL